ncbi:MAG: hypothetical protein EOM24_21320, partial [Chloroflexia bacterium]|nr:hypothetical protein [Chloroflexia bacterium]
MKRTSMFISAIFILISLTLLLSHTPVQAAECTWLGGTGNWSNPANWSGCAGGVPGVNDTAVISDGTVTLDTPVILGGLTMSGGAISGSPTLTVTNNILFTGDTKIIAGITLVNAGTAVWEAGDIGFGPHPNPRGYFVNQAGATFNIAGGVNTLSANGASITNHGTMSKIGLDTSNIRGTAVINHGLLEVQEGVLTINGSYGDPHSGAFELAADTLLEFWESQRFGPTSSITGEGNVSFRNNSASNWIFWVLDNGATFNISGRTRLACPQCFVNFNGNQAHTGDLLLDGAGSGTATEGRANGSLTVNGLFHWRAGQVGSMISNNTEPFTVHALGGILIDHGPASIDRDGIVINHGQAVYSGGQFYLRYSQSRFYNLPGATFELQGEMNLDYRLGGSDVPNGRFINQGTLLK